MSRPEVFADGRAVMRLVGDVDMASAPSIVETARALAAEGCRRVWFDCTSLEFMDPAGLNAMLRVRDLLGGADAVVVFRPKDLIRRLMAVTGMDTVVAIETEPSWLQPSF
ncbi:MAG: anti-sigma factor antagonist [Acidimicrobiales bacterium]|nr:anti-sigma factor antagonist [Acidimicrobiales bacterium]